MGVVYVARHDGSGAEVALKTVRLARRRNLAGIRAEIRALASLRHPGIVKIADYGVEGSAPWFAMELLHGQNLGVYVTRMWADTLGGHADEIATISDVESRLAEAALAAAQPRPHLVPATARPPRAAAGHLQDVMRISCELCRALAYLHRNGLLHGDLKPSNIFVCADGRIILLDFGLVSQARGSIGRESLETAGAVRGTLPYLAPERLRGDFADARADLYGVGVMLYEALTGQLPFRGTRAADILAAQQAGIPGLPSHLVSDLPPQLDRLVKELLAFSPQERLGHAEDVIAVLESLGAPPASTPVEAGARTTYLYRPPLAGRGAVLDGLLRRLSEATSGRGGVVLLTGESGVGKTALMSEFGRRANQRHLTVVNGECIPLGAGGEGGEGGVDIKEAPLHPLRGLLQDVADRCSEWPESTVEALLGSRGKLLARYEPILETVPGWSRFAEPADLPADAALQRIMRELRGLLATLAEQTGPLVLLIDDLQWADELSIRFLRSLDAEFFGRTPVLFVATVRRDEMSPELQALADAPGVETVRLERLDEHGVGEMIAGMLSMIAAPPSLVRFLSHQSEGNPFFVAEYLRLAVEEHVVVRQEGRWQLEGDGVATIEGLRLPGSLRGLVERRLGGLTADAREAVDVGAVIGRTFEISLVAELLGVDEEEARRRLREPTSLMIVADAGAGLLRFAHDKLRETAYSALTPERRRDLHLRVARSVEAHCRGDRAALTDRSPELAHHYKLAQEPSSAVEYLELAGEAALRKSAHQEAALFLEDAIATADRAGLAIADRRRGRLERMIGDAYLALGQHEVSLTHYQVALRSLGAPVPEKESRVAGSLFHSVASQAARRFGLTALVGKPHPGSELLLEQAQIHNSLLQIYYYRGGPLPRMMHAMLSSMNLAELAGPSPVLALGYVNAGATAGIMPLRKVADHYFELARRALAAHPNDEVETFVDLLESHYRFGVGDLARAKKHLESSMEISQRMGFLRRWEEVAGLYRSILLMQGHLDEALSLGEKILASTKRGDRQTQCWELVGRAHVLLAKGDSEGALRDASLAVEIASGQLRQELLRSSGALAGARLHCGDLEGATKAADAAAVQIDAGPPLGPYWLEPYCDVIDVRFAAWDGGAADGRRAAERAVAALEKLARVFPVTTARLHLYRGHLLRRLDKLPQARKEWKQGIATAQAGDLPYDAALDEAALGASLEPSSPERRERLARARDGLKRIGAHDALRGVETALGGA